MTLEEIIRGLKFTVDMFLFDPSTGETFTEPRNDMDQTTIDACKGAIELLEQQPCEDIEEIREVMVCDADAETKCKMIYNILNAKPHYFKKQEPCKNVVNCEYLEECKELMTDINGDTVYAVRMSDIRNLPSVTPQQKTGHWINDKCSVCGKGIEDLIDSYEWYRNEKPKFCPFCGAVMEGE